MSSGLGDVIHDALEAIGITSERVERWLGVPCNCAERQAKLNSLGRWAARIIKGHRGNAEVYLEQILEE